MHLLPLLFGTPQFLGFPSMSMEALFQSPLPLVLFPQKSSCWTSPSAALYLFLSKLTPLVISSGLPTWRLPHRSSHRCYPPSRPSLSLPWLFSSSHIHIQSIRNSAGFVLKMYQELDLSPPWLPLWSHSSPDCCINLPSRQLASAPTWPKAPQMPEEVLKSGSYLSSQTRWWLPFHSWENQSPYSGYQSSPQSASSSLLAVISLILATTLSVTHSTPAAYPWPRTCALVVLSPWNDPFPHIST